MKSKQLYIRLFHQVNLSQNQAYVCAHLLMDPEDPIWFIISPPHTHIHRILKLKVQERKFSVQDNICKMVAVLSNSPQTTL